MKTYYNYSPIATLRNLLGLLVLIIITAIYLPTVSNAQCIIPPVQPTCASGVTLVDNETLTTGITKVVSGSSTFSNLTLSGGTLIVCGTLNLSGLTFNSGTIYVCAGATLNVNTSASIVFGTGCSIYNYGTTYFASSIVTGPSNLIVNCTTSSYFNIPFNQFVLQGPNTQFVNYGVFNSSFFIVQSNNSPNPVCSGASSVIITATMINSLPNAFTSPSGISCIQITNQAINSQPMTSTANVNICYSGSSSSGLNFGNATVTLNCTSCSIPLPVENITLNGTCINSTLQLNWSVESQLNCTDYEVQTSKNGLTFQTIREVPCTGNSTTTVHYSNNIQIEPTGEYYVRIKGVDTDENENYSSVITLNCLKGSSIEIFPTYVVGSQITIKADDRIIGINMYSMDGRKVKTFDIEPNQTIVVLNIGSDTALGQYLLTVETPAMRVDKLIHVAH